jgi:hypothetical protein
MIMHKEATEQDKKQSGELVCRMVWLGMLISSIYLFSGCETIKENTTEPKARQAAEWIKERAGFIEDAVAGITRVAVYASEKDTYERERTLEIMRSMAGNLNALISQGNFNPDEVKQALKINEPYFGEIASALASLIQIELKNFDNNGYADLSLTVLKAVTAGIKDGTTL